MNNTNEENRKYYEDRKQFHINDNGTAPEEFAVTELIKRSIADRDYKIYYGGGSDVNANRVLNFDVVVWFSLAGDPYFMVCMDNSEGDECDLYRCNIDGELEMMRR
jgi:hypothetical protein